MLIPDLFKAQDGRALYLFMINYGQIEDQKIALISYLGHEERKYTQKCPAVSFAGGIDPREPT